jgi:hypothetical protein
VNPFTRDAHVDDEERARRQFGKNLVSQVLHRAAFFAFVVIDVALLANLWPATPGPSA